MQLMKNRGQIEMVFGLATIHYLAISTNAPFKRITESFSYIGHWLLMEFVTKDDPQSHKL